MFASVWAKGTFSLFWAILASALLIGDICVQLMRGRQASYRPKWRFAQSSVSAHNARIRHGGMSVLGLCQETH